MADITKCKGEGCPAKESCYRYTAIADEYWQYYLVECPYEIIEQTESYIKVKCDMYWGESQTSIYDNLKCIVNGK